jgi:hypothetical protein
MNPHHPGSGRGRSCRPCLERLEDRDLLSVDFAVLGNTLLVMAPTTRSRANAAIAIFDNGTQGPNNVIGLAATPFFPDVRINNVIIQLSRGNNNVIYRLNGALTGNRFVFANMSRGNDSFHAFVSGDLLPGSNLTFSVAGSPRHGGDSITGQFTSNIKTGANLTWTTFGASGNTVLGFNLNGTVSPGGVVMVSQTGGMGSDQISTGYGGLMNGVLGLAELGGQAGNNLFADVELLSGSTGVLQPSVIRGNGGNNQLAYMVHDPTHKAIIYNQILDGGPGMNVADRTSNVLAFDTTWDTVLP